MASLLRSKREFPPKHFSLRLHSFSKVAKACPDVYESVAFTVENFSWKLNLYPNGNTKGNGKDHISLHLTIDDLASDEDVHAEFKLFVFDKNNNNYLTIHDDKVKRFHNMKKKWGYDQLLSLAEFKNPQNGYLVNDCCEFGVEITVVASSTITQQSLSMIKPPQPFRRTFKDYSKMGKAFQCSDPFSTSGGKTWKVRLYPKGNGKEEGNSLSIYLELVDAQNLSPGERVWVETKLRVIDQHQDNHHEKTVTKWFSCSDNVWGYQSFMPLGDLHEDKKGFVVNDALMVEVEFVDVSTTDIFTGLLP